METYEHGELIKCVSQCKDWYNSNKVDSGEVDKFYSAAIRYFYSIHWEGKKRTFLDISGEICKGYSKVLEL